MQDLSPVARIGSIVFDLKEEFVPRHLAHACYLAFHIPKRRICTLFSGSGEENVGRRGLASLVTVGWAASLRPVGNMANKRETRRE